MNIKDLKTKQGSVEVEGVIKEIEEPRFFTKFGRELKVANAILEDESGFIKLTLWNDDIDSFRIGDVVKIINGFVNEFQGEKQLTSGRFGKIEKLGEKEVSKSEGPSETEDKEKETLNEDESTEESEDKAEEIDGESFPVIEKAPEDEEESEEKDDESSEEAKEKPEENAESEDEEEESEDEEES